ncbi:MAG: rRNA maturation RNase YbeY [Bacteroidota bacterium]
MPILFYFNDTNFKIKKVNKIKQWIKTVIEKEKYQIGKINYIFCNDAELLEINIKHLNHHTFTDIITFDYSEKTKINSDIFISIERVTENAVIYSKSFEEELHRVMIHGILHLCGYKDKGYKNKQLMRKKEDESLELGKFL